jgi:ATP-dependent 26S proteasome regulatory subunit
MKHRKSYDGHQRATVEEKTNVEVYTLKRQRDIAVVGKTRQDDTETTKSAKRIAKTLRPDTTGIIPTMNIVAEQSTVTFSDIGGCESQCLVGYYLLH